MLSLFYLTGFSQIYIKKNEKTLLVERSCEIKSNNPDCFIYEIPFNYRTNQKDTLRYCFDEDSCFYFYKGKCDTVCGYDTTELFFNFKNLYDNSNKKDSINELYYIKIMSKILKHFNEVNLSADKDSASTLMRFSYFGDTLLTIINIEEKKNKRVLNKKIIDWHSYSTDSVKYQIEVEITRQEWDKLLKSSNSNDLFSPSKKFTIFSPDLLIEYKRKNDYKCIYLYHYEIEISKDLKKLILRFVKILNKY